MTEEAGGGSDLGGRKNGDICLRAHAVFICLRAHAVLACTAIGDVCLGFVCAIWTPVAVCSGAR